MDSTSQILKEVKILSDHCSNFQSDADVMADSLGYYSSQNNDGFITVFFCDI